MNKLNFKLFVVLIISSFIALNQMQVRGITTDGHSYMADEKTGVTCKNLWILDRVHTPEQFLRLPFVAEAGTKARTAVMDGERGKIYIGYSKPVVVNSVSNDYAHLVVFDLETGAYEKEIALTCDGVPVSGLLCANQVGIDDAGNLWVCGMYSDVCAKPAQIYVVTNRETGECKNVGQWALPTEESDAGGRCDYWDVVGDITGKTSNAVCMTAVGNTAGGEKLCIYRWELAQGSTEWKASSEWGTVAKYVSKTYPADQTTWGTSSATVRIVAEEGHVGSMFYVDGFTTCPSLYNIDFQMVESFASAPDLAPFVGCNGVNEFVLGETPFIVYAEATYNVSPGCRINVCQLGEDGTFNGMRKLWSLPEGGFGEVSDGGTRIHNIDTYKVVDKNGKESVYLLTYKCFNGMGLYLITDNDSHIKIDPTTSQEINGVIYEIKDEETVRVKSYSEKISNTIEIPSQVDINGVMYNVTEIAKYAFSACTGLTSITIPKTVTKIDSCAFQGCTGLTTISIPNSVSQIDQKAFWGCEKLLTSMVINKTQTTATIALSTSTKYKTGVVNENGKIASESNIVSIKGLKPGVNHTYNAALIINDIFCEINSVSFTTDDVIFKNSDIVGATSVSSKANYEGDVIVLEYGIKWGDNAVEYNNIDSISVYNLDPDTNYDIYYFLNTKEGGEYSTSWSVRTKLLTWNVGEFVATSTTSARLSVETNCDAPQGTGYEWKRYDAPETLAPSKAPCPVVNGKLTGSLRGLNSSAYYNCRPYYTSSSGKTYYGEWFTIFTGDANVYFEPEVSTSDKNTVVDNSAVINGYALAGSDDILEQGFEYWKSSTSPVAYSSSGVMIAKASGISMSATITNLEYNSTYRYRAYVKTSKGSFYGSEKELIIGDPAGVGYIESDVKDAEEVARYDIHGRRLNKPTKGINIIKMSNGTTRKEIVK